MYKVFSGLVSEVAPVLNHEFNNYLCNSTRYQSFRWKRKPRWLPVAKSKMFRVPERKKLPSDEYELLKTLYNNYRTEMKSIRYYMKEKVQQSTTAPEVLAEQARLEEEEHLSCINLNNEWNEKVRHIRETRIEAEKEKEIENIMRTLELHEKEEADRKARIEQLVREEKEKAKTYITKANLEAAIEEALTKEVDYNFAIDLDCNIYQGRRARPEMEGPKPDPEGNRPDTEEIQQEPHTIAQTN